MALTREQSIAKYGNESYTAWDENAAAQDAKAKGIGQPVSTPTQVQSPVVQTQQQFSTPSVQSNQFGSVQDLISAGYGGYAGWDSNAAIEDFKKTGGSGKQTGGTNQTSTPTINLQDNYNKLVEESGISGLETNVNSIESTINQMSADAAAQKAKINENPFLSEASRIGRIAKIDEKLQNAIAPLQKDIANLTNQLNQKRTDISNKLNLGVQQYNIDIASKQQNLSNFNALLGAGALNNATPQDIATLVSQTGLSSTMIQNLITQAKQNQISPQIISNTDDNGNVTVSTIDSRTGNLINTTNIGKVAGTKSSTGTATKKSENLKILDQTLISNRNSYGHVSPAIYNAAMEAYVSDGLGTYADFEKQYSSLRDPNRTDNNQASGYMVIVE